MHELMQQDGAHATAYKIEKGDQTAYKSREVKGGKTSCAGNTGHAGTIADAGNTGHTGITAQERSSNEAIPTVLLPHPTTFKSKVKNDTALRVLPLCVRRCMFTAGCVSGARRMAKRECKDSGLARDGRPEGLWALYCQFSLDQVACCGRIIDI